MRRVALASGKGPRRGGKRRGFTLIELLVVMAVLSILAAIAVPRLRGVVLKAQAADVLGDLNVVKVAVMTYQADNSSWPRDRGRGRVPPELVDYLPGGFSFQKDDYVLDYDNRTRRRRAAFKIGVTFITRNEELGAAVMKLVGSSIWTNGRRKFTWILDG